MKKTVVLLAAVACVALNSYEAFGQARKPTHSSSSSSRSSGSSSRSVPSTHRPSYRPSTNSYRPTPPRYRPTPSYTPSRPTPTHRPPTVAHVQPHRPPVVAHVQPHHPGSSSFHPHPHRPGQPFGRLTGSSARPNHLNPGTMHTALRPGAVRPAVLLFPRSGVKLTAVYAGPASRQGLKQGDTILSFGGRPTPTFDDLRSAVQQAGGEAEMVYINGDTGEQESVTVFPEDSYVGVSGEAVDLDEGSAESGPANEPEAAFTVADTTWTGSEDLAGFGSLSFLFGDDGSAVMIDAKNRVRGSWSQNGSDVTVRFNNCVYQGSIQNGQFSGTAQYADGQQSWSFQVALRQE